MLERLCVLMSQCYIFQFPWSDLPTNSGHSYGFSSVSCDAEYGNGKRALETFTILLKCWKRYVDDIFYIVPKDLVASLFRHINNIEQFTLENENAQGYLSFLDVQSDDGY